MKIGFCFKNYSDLSIIFKLNNVSNSLKINVENNIDLLETQEMAALRKLVLLPSC